MRKAVCNQLAESWQNKRVDKTFILDQLPEASPTLKTNWILPTESRHFSRHRLKLPESALNQALPEHDRHPFEYGTQPRVLVDEAALTKLLILERCGHKDAYKNVLRAALEDDGGKAAF